MTISVLIWRCPCCYGDIRVAMEMSVLLCRQALNPTTLDHKRMRSDGLGAVSGLRQSIIPDARAYGLLAEALHRRQDPVTISVDSMMAILLPFARETRASFTSAYSVRWRFMCFLFSPVVYTVTGDLGLSRSRTK